MLYTTLTVCENEYKCRLTTKGCVDLEKKLGANPISIFMNIANNQLPKIEDMVAVLHASM